MLKAVTWATGLVAVALVNVAMTGPATAQELSEKSVKTFMDYTWSLVPQQFTPPNGGKTILIDKDKKSEVIVPVDVAREIIRVGRLSAHAQVCDLPKAQLFNFRSMMQRELNKKTWSQQQLVYISQLHLTTVMLLTGKIKLIEKKDGKEVVIQESKTASTTCTNEQKKKVLKVITAYVDAGPNFKVAVPKPEPAAGKEKAAGAPDEPAKKTADKKE
ncbi:MAG: hypothetical protein ACRBCJ_02205 [Hyphomicrobiaceae bacterium]